MRRRSLLRIGLPALFLFLMACVQAPMKPPVVTPPTPPSPPEPGAPILDRIDWGNAGTIFDDMDFAGLTEAARQSLAYYERRPEGTSFEFGNRRVGREQLIRTMNLFLEIVDDPDLDGPGKVDRIRRDFTLYRSRGGDETGRVLFTGYYEPIMRASRRRSASFPHPVYGLPDDLIKVDLKKFPLANSTVRVLGRMAGDEVIPYYSRSQIDGEGVLRGRGLELLWFEDPVEVFFLHVQGSGRAELEDGTSVHVLYDGKNGQPYRSIGRRLIDKGILPEEEVSLQGIREYLRRNSEQVRETLDHNPSYVFFRLDDEGPFGSIGVPLTPGRSVATDPSVFPQGGLCLIQTRKPRFTGNGEEREWTPFSRFVVNQDTGGAIKGAGRVDLFWGAGKEAERSAGVLKEYGELYFLLAK